MSAKEIPMNIISFLSTPIMSATVIQMYIISFFSTPISQTNGCGNHESSPCDKPPKKPCDKPCDKPPKPCCDKPPKKPCDKPPKPCCDKPCDKPHRCLFATLLTIIIIIIFIILVIWLVLRPTKPRFALQDATVTQFNVITPNTLSSTLQVTLHCRNPNDRIGIYYDRLLVYASYHNQQITLATVIPSTYQGHEDINIWSPFLCGSSVPVSPYLTLSLQQDQNVGFFLLNIKIDGRVKWKVGTWISGTYHLSVSCPAYLTYSSTNGIRLQQPASCHVDV